MSQALPAVAWPKSLFSLLDIQRPTVIRPVFPCLGMEPCRRIRRRRRLEERGFNFRPYQALTRASDRKQAEAWNTCVRVCVPGNRTSRNTETNDRLTPQARSCEVMTMLPLYQFPLAHRFSSGGDSISPSQPDSRPYIPYTPTRQRR